MTSQKPRACLWLGVLIVGVSIAGCSSGNNTPDATLDGGSQVDAGSTIPDASSDAGQDRGPDAGTALVDAGLTADAGTPGACQPATCLTNSDCPAFGVCSNASDGGVCLCQYGFEAAGDVCEPDVCGGSSPCDVNSETVLLLAQIRAAMLRFYADTGYWPYANSGWSAAPGYAYSQIEPKSFNQGDTALTQSTAPALPSGYPALPVCSTLWTTVSPGAACWNGPYVPIAASMGDIVDPWGNPLYYTLVRPADGWGGGVAAEPWGFVALWSIGPDGIDETGCGTGACDIDYVAIAHGRSSLPACGPAGTDAAPCSDDIVTLVGWAEPPESLDGGPFDAGPPPEGPQPGVGVPVCQDSGG